VAAGRTALGIKSDALSPRMINLIGELVQDWRRLDERIASVSTEIEALAKQDERLMSVPGVGPIVSSAEQASIATFILPSKQRLSTRLPVGVSQVSHPWDTKWDSRADFTPTALASSRRPGGRLAKPSQVPEAWPSRRSARSAADGW
jgi:hypothetical protein